MKLILIEKEAADQRLDKFLKKQFPEISRSQLQKFVRKGFIVVNDQKVKTKYTLKEKDRLKINLKKKKAVKILPNPSIKIDIIFENKDFLVINKPAGLLIHPDNVLSQKTLASALIARFPQLRNVGEPQRPGIVHRLDKETSGLVLVAKKQKVLEDLQRLFLERKIIKKYWALVHGRPKNKKGELKTFIYRSKKNYRKRISTLDFPQKSIKIRRAVTFCQLLKVYQKGKNQFLSLLELEPKTGRTHQIRAQLSGLGHPVAGDQLYALKKFKKARIKNHLLHARSLSFNFKNQNYHFESPLPKNFQIFLNKLKIYDSNIN